MMQQKIPPGPLRESVFSHINPIFFLSKFEQSSQRLHVPLNCPISKRGLKTPIINTECPTLACYFSATALVKQLDNQLCGYTCPVCQQPRHSKNLIYDPGFESHLETFELSRNTSVNHTHFYLSSGGVHSTEEPRELLKELEEELMAKKQAIVRDYYENQETRTIEIAMGKLEEQWDKVLREKSEVGNEVLVARGIKNRSEQAFSTIAVFLEKGGTFQLKMKINGQTYLMPSRSEIKFSKALSAFIIVACHEDKLRVLKGSTKNIESDTVNFEEIASLPPRKFPGIAVDNRYVYILGGLDDANSKILTRVDKIDCQKKGHTELPPLNEQRCGFKAAIMKGRLYAIGGGNRLFGPFKHCDKNQYFDFAKNAWVQIQADQLKAFNFGVIPTQNQDIAIIYGGYPKEDGYNQHTTFHLYNLNNHQIIESGSIKELSTVPFDFDNGAINNTVVRALPGQQQQFLVVKFENKGSFSVRKEQLGEM